MKSLGKLDKSILPVFITLTYPGQYPEEGKEWKRHLKNFIHRLVYKFPEACGVWKLEPQKRGAPHYHLLIWGVEYYDLWKFTGKNWFEVVGSGDINHLKAGTQVKKIDSWRGVVSYTSKYIGKVINDVGWGEVGRYWGVFQRDKLSWSEVEIFEVTQRQAIEAIRYFKRYGGIKNRNYPSLDLFVRDISQWKKLLL